MDALILAAAAAAAAAAPVLLPSPPASGLFSGLRVLRESSCACAGGDADLLSKRVLRRGSSSSKRLRLRGASVMVGGVDGGCGWDGEGVSEGGRAESREQRASQPGGFEKSSAALAKPKLSSPDFARVTTGIGCELQNADKV